jgi:hypothetical protein
MLHQEEESENKFRKTFVVVFKTLQIFILL